MTTTPYRDNDVAGGPRHFRVEGFRVQGSGFRAWTQQFACADR